MIVTDTHFDPIKDLNPVSQTGFVDLNSAFANNFVPSVSENAESDYNGIEDPASILGRPRDVFEGLEMESYIREASASAKEDKD